MSLKAYEDACLRAELFGQPKPDKDEFLEKHKHLDIVEFEEVDIKTTSEQTAMLNDDIRQVGGGLNELNTILNSTQTKINRLKEDPKNAPAKFDGFPPFFSEPSYVGQTNYDKDYVPPGKSDLGSINQDLGPVGPDDNEMTPRAGKSNQNGGNLNMTEKSNSTVAALKNVGEKMSSQTSTLENLLSRAEHAESSMSHQNKQMRSFLR